VVKNPWATTLRETLGFHVPPTCGISVCVEPKETLGRTHLLPDLQPFCEPSRQSSSALAVFKSKTAVSSGFGKQYSYCTTDGLDLFLHFPYLSILFWDDSRLAGPCQLGSTCSLFRCGPRLQSSWFYQVSGSSGDQSGGDSAGTWGNLGRSNQNCPLNYLDMCV
jgi:hypothetical protein